MLNVVYDALAGQVRQGWENRHYMHPEGAVVLVGVCWRSPNAYNMHCSSAVELSWPPCRAHGYIQS